MRPVSHLLSHFDAFGWVPTIRGALSLDLFSSTSNTFGDVDRHSTVFRKSHGFNTEFYLASTALATTNDKKVGADISRTFRFFFVGKISRDGNHEGIVTDDAYLSDELTTSLLADEGALLGKVIVIPEFSNVIPENELVALRFIRDLEKEKDLLANKYYLESAPFEQLNAVTNKLLRLWRQYSESIDVIRQKEEGRVYEFEILLTRAGMLLIKDASREEFRKDYSADDPSTDYRQNIPLPRIFKYVMNFVKYMFHTNYHHNHIHDTYLPATNLSPYKTSGQCEFAPVFRHQLDSLLTPLTRLKRKGFADYSINPNGIVSYSKSFVNACADCGLITNKMREEKLRYLDIQESEINHMTQSKKSVLNTILAQCNIVFILTGVLAVMVGILKIASTFFSFPRYGDKGVSLVNIWPYLLGSLSLTALITIIFIWSQKRIQAKQFKRESKIGRLTKWLLKNSNLDKSTLSWRYRTFLKIQDIKLHIKRAPYLWIITSSLLILLIILIILVFTIIL